MFTDFETIHLGETRSIVKKITLDDVRKFVEMTGDNNPLHIDPAFAEQTAFKDIVVHGMLGASFLSTVIGTKLPGPGALWVAQSFEFLLPVRLGDELTVSCTVTGKHERERLLELATNIINQCGQTVLTGVGKVKVLACKPKIARAEPKNHPKVAIVTGGSGGIGGAICLSLAASGYQVVVNYVERKDRAEHIVTTIKGLGGNAIAVQGNVATDAGSQYVYDVTLSTFGTVGLLVNNASPRVNPKGFIATEWNDIQSHLDIQVKGAFLMSKVCLPEMTARGWGRIINITSQVTESAPSITWTGYAVAKASLSMLSRYMAAEFGPLGVTVNCVSPGMTETSFIGDIPEKVQLMIARQTPLRRLAVPEDIAAAVLFLASEEARFITGQTLRVNGGSTMP